MKSLVVTIDAGPGNILQSRSRLNENLHYINLNRALWLTIQLGPSSITFPRTEVDVCVIPPVVHASLELRYTYRLCSNDCKMNFAEWAGSFHSSLWKTDDWLIDRSLACRCTVQSLLRSLVRQTLRHLRLRRVRFMLFISLLRAATVHWQLTNVTVVMAALCNSGAIIFLPCGFFLLSSSSFFFSSPNLSGHRLDVYHTSTHGVALVRI